MVKFTPIVTKAKNSKTFQDIPMKVAGNLHNIIISKVTWAFFDIMKTFDFTDITKSSFFIFHKQ